MRTVSAFEAKNRLGQLLDLVESGEDVVIRRHGKDVARMVPIRGEAQQEQALAALKRLRERAARLKNNRFDWEEWKAYRDEGRARAFAREG
jgi:prevent-host-death family protein